MYSERVENNVVVITRGPSQITAQTSVSSAARKRKTRDYSTPIPNTISPERALERDKQYNSANARATNQRGNSMASSRN